MRRFAVRVHLFIESEVGFCSVVQLLLHIGFISVVFGLR